MIELFAFCGAQHIAKGDVNEAVRRNSHRKANLGNWFSAFLPKLATFDLI
ncbi:MAG TPA: hypothetical protein PLK30_17455 [Blastocatellia bacterium]|nr:hypothetical protein [Blastocatellia bacterium]